MTHQLQYVQRSRKAGAHLPPNTRCCTRGTRWGNPFYIHTPQINVEDYKAWFAPSAEENIAKLAGYDYLACWCKPGDACHVQDVLLPMVNKYLRELEKRG